MTDTVKRGIRGYKRYKKRVRILKIFTLFVVCIGALLLLNKAAAYYGKVDICISVNDAEILQGEK
ncbi:MAG: hypothetical protein ACI4UH_01375, partial [Dorea sp.]